MRVRRCRVLFLELREEVEFDLSVLLAGSAGLRRNTRWLALAPHLDAEVEISGEERELLGAFSCGSTKDVDEQTAKECTAFRRLVDTGLLISDADDAALHRSRDQLVRDHHWWPAAAMFHRQGRWNGVDGAKAMEENDLLTADGVLKQFGPPPAHVGERAPHTERIPLPLTEGGDLDALLARRATCRNFAAHELSGCLFAKMLQRVFSAQAQARVGENSVFLKKTSPSGGGLHATETYLIVLNVEGIAPGLYHYHPVDHALEPLPGPDVPLADFAKLALAGQHWFSTAPVLVVLAPRFARSFWKYRHHAKAYRALILDSGHLSQTLYLSATDLGLGAFVTSAINEIDIEQAFGMDPLEESPLAICGFGWRAERMETTEFDPAGEVWEAGG